MRNLKRALSLVMAMALIVGMMVVSASAAGSDFTDNDEIDHKEAVNTMVTLNVISGKEDGSYYDPDGSLTRAEMAKVVAYVMNGGVEPVVGTKLVPTYSDIKGHWAEKYIEYCTSMGIISGDGAGKFNPEGTLTAEQCAKMFLTAMGYNANVFGFTGNDWAINVGRYANEANLYEDLGDITPSAVITRDDAAQMAYNAIQATMMERSWSQDLATGQVGETYTPWIEGGIPVTLLGQKFNGTVYEGVLTTSGEYGIGAATNEDTFTVNVEKVNGRTATGTAAGNHPFTWEDTDLTSMVGTYVKALVNERTEEIYGVYPVADKNTVDITTTANKVSLDSGKIKVDGTTYNYESGAIVYVDGGAGQTVAASSAYIASTAVAKADNVRLISNNGDSKIDVILVNTINVTKLPYVGTTDFTVTTPGVGSRTIDSDGVAGLSDYASAAQDLADVNVYDGMAKGDYVILSENYYTMEDAVAKVETATGTITGTKTGQWQIDGEWYKPYAGYNGMNVLENGDTLNYIAINGIVYFAEKTTANSVSNIAAVITVGENTGSSSTVSGSTLEVKLLRADGTKETKAVSKITIDGVTTEIDSNADITAAIGSGGVAKQLIGDLVVFKVDNDGNYELSNIPDNSTTKADIANFDRSLDSASGVGYIASGTGAKTIAGVTLADDAVVFVIHTPTRHVANSSNDGKVFTGEEIKRLTSNFGTGASSLNFAPGLVTTVNGISEVAVAVLSSTADIPTITGAGTNYGYLTAGTYWHTDPETGKTYNVYTYWDGTQTVTAREESTTQKLNYAAGQVIGFDVVGENEIKNVAMVGATGRVSGYSESKNSLQLVEVSGTYEITNDTTILYVDSDAVEGRTGGGIDLASDLDGDGTRDVNNVRYIVVPATNEVELLVVDVNNNFKGSSLAEAAADTDDVAGITAALKEADVVTAGTVADLAGLSIPAGKTVKVNTVTAIGSSGVSVSGTLEIGTLTAATGAITGTGTVKVGTITAGGAQLQTSTVQVTAANTATTIETIPAVSGKTLIIDVKSSDASTNTTVGASLEFWATAGKAAAADGTGGVNGTSALDASSYVAAGTYVGGTVYYKTTYNGDTNTTAWILQ